MHDEARRIAANFAKLPVGGDDINEQQRKGFGLKPPVSKFLWRSAVSACVGHAPLGFSFNGRSLAPPANFRTWGQTHWGVLSRPRAVDTAGSFA